MVRSLANRNFQLRPRPAPKDGMDVAPKEGMVVAPKDGMAVAPTMRLSNYLTLKGSFSAGWLAGW